MEIPRKSLASLAVPDGIVRRKSGEGCPILYIIGAAGKWESCIWLKCGLFVASEKALARCGKRYVLPDGDPKCLISRAVSSEWDKKIVDVIVDNRWALGILAA